MKFEGFTNKKVVETKLELLSVVFIFSRIKHIRGVDSLIDDCHQNQ